MALVAIYTGLLEAMNRVELREAVQVANDLALKRGIVSAATFGRAKGGGRKGGYYLRRPAAVDLAAKGGYMMTGDFVAPRSLSGEANGTPYILFARQGGEIVSALVERRDGAKLDWRGIETNLLHLVLDFGTEASLPCHRDVPVSYHGTSYGRCLTFLLNNYGVSTT